MQRRNQTQCFELKKSIIQKVKTMNFIIKSHPVEWTISFLDNITITRTATVVANLIFYN